MGGMSSLALSLHLADSFMCLSYAQCATLYPTCLQRGPDLEHGELVSVNESESHSWNAGPLCGCLPALAAAEFSLCPLKPSGWTSVLII